MSAYLLTWNLKMWPEAKVSALADTCAHAKSVEVVWSAGNRSEMSAGDVVYLVRCGSNVRGIVGIGEVLARPERGPKWGGSSESDAEGWNVRVRFTTVVTQPIINALELRHTPFTRKDRWAPQSSGVRLSDICAAALHDLLMARLALVGPDTPNSGAAIRARWDSYRTWAGNLDPAALDAASHEAHEASRIEAQQVLQQYLEQAIDFRALTKLFQTKTKKEWSSLRLSGQCHAMVLNQIDASLSNSVGFDALLRDVLSAPSTAQAAEEKLQKLVGYVNDAHAPTPKPGLLSTFLSGLWHVQRPDVWPIQRDATTLVLRADGMLDSPHPKKVPYPDFIAAHDRTRSATGLDSWHIQTMSRTIAAALKDEAKNEESTQKDQPYGVLDGLSLPFQTAETASFWLIAPGREAEFMSACRQDEVICIGWPEIGDLGQYADVSSTLAALQDARPGQNQPHHSARACYEFSHRISSGDLIFAKNGTTEIIAVGQVLSTYKYAPHEAIRPGHPNVLSVAWHTPSDAAPWKTTGLPKMTLTKFKPADPRPRNILGHFFGAPKAPGFIPTTHLSADPYTSKDALKSLFCDPNFLGRALELLRRKKNIILTGSPGTGKSFFAEHLAHVLIGQRPAKQARLGSFCFVQFHQAMSYEDFVLGFRANAGGGFSLEEGIFLQFCRKAAQDSSKRPHVLLIDEINRGNLSKIFGELLMLIEADKRSSRWSVSLSHRASSSAEKAFFVPENLHIIGTMNQADRSLIGIDYALRRRFSFLSIEPAFRSEAFRRDIAARGIDGDFVKIMAQKFEALNKVIQDDPRLGTHFVVGHSYFCEEASFHPNSYATWYEQILEQDIDPILEAYWFDDIKTAREQKKLLRMADA